MSEAQDGRRGLSPRGERYLGWLDAEQAAPFGVGPLAYGPDAPGGGTDAAADDDAAEAPGAPPVLPDDFWSARPHLAAIRAFARSRHASPDAVLTAAIVRAGVAAPPGARALTDQGGGTPMSMFAISVAPSGAGKTSSTRAVRDLVNLAAAGVEAGDQPIGSGEGIAEAFMGEVPTGEPSGKGKQPATRREQVRQRAHFHIDEGEALLRLLRRDAATLGETLRRAFTGEPLGQRNASSDRTRVVKDYTLGVTLNCTPGTVAGILSFAEAGLPQRFLWASGIDPTAPRHPRCEPAPALPSVRGSIQFAPEILDETGEARWLARTGRSEVPELDAHLPLIRLRVAAILAAWDGRDEAGADDWSLAGRVVATSCAVRDAALREAEAIAAAERAQRAHEKGQIAQVVRSMSDQATTALELIAARIGRRVHKAPAPMTRSALRDGCAKTRERHMFVPALDLAIARGWAADDGEHVKAGPSRPAE